jgi:urease accessory protein
MSNPAQRLWLLVSPGLPVGGYSYSQGLEFAVQAGWVRSADDTRDWIGGLAHTVLPRLDLPLLLRIARALRAGDTDALEHWNGYLLASRESAELRREDCNMGRALRRLASGLLGHPTLVDALPRPTFAASFAAIGHAWAVADPDLCAAYAWVWFDNQIAAAVKLVPLGQTQGQRLLLELTDQLDALTAAAVACPDTELGQAAAGLALASAAHETQYSRLFQS